MRIFGLNLTGVAALLTLMVACHSNTTSEVERVRTVEQKLSDTTIVVRGSGHEHLVIVADATVEYPLPIAADDTLASHLQSLFITHVLAYPDTLTIDEALRSMVSNTLHQNDFAQSDASGVTEFSTDEYEDDDITEYHTTTAVNLVSQEHDLLTFRRVDVVKKDTVVTGVAHRYYTIDLQTMQPVSLRRLFNEEAVPYINRMLRERLLELNHVTSNDRLNDLGYYNADNMGATNNFYITDAGVTWSFLPGEIAVGAVGEPTITIELDYLSQMLAPRSPLVRFYNQ